MATPCVSDQENTLYITLNYDTKKSSFKYYLGRKLQCKLENIKIVHFEKINDTVNIEVQFLTKHQAKKAYHQLKTKTKMKVSLDGFDGVNKYSEKLSSIRNALLRKECQLTLEHQKKISQLENEIDLVKAEITKVSFDEKLDKLFGNIKALEDQISEKLQQKREYEIYYQLLHESINELEAKKAACLESEISQIERKVEIECRRFENPLPIYAKRQFILDEVFGNQVVIIIGETGSGKSTQMVQYLYDAGYAADGKLIVCTQPRKVAAVTLAGHVSTEMCSPLGDLVGYQFRIGGKFCDKTKIVYTTDHSLLNECIADKTLSRYSCLVIDEAHERNLNTDLLLAFIKQCLSSRDDLKVIITSATIKPELFINYFGDCPVINISGRTFPVDIIWDPLKVNSSPLTRDYTKDAIEVIKQIHKNEPMGDILVFLTSPSEIDQACKCANKEISEDDYVILPLHGKLQPEEQKEVFMNYGGKQKIVFSTNVAETSLTIPGIKYIIDSGLAKELHFDAKRNMNSLEVRMISKSSAEQRKGRAGRTNSGKCYRLYSKEHFQIMPERTTPEILRIHLSHTVLKLYEFGIVNIMDFDFLERPDKTTLITALETLHDIHALKNDDITELGRKLAVLPFDPRLGKILLDSIEVGVGLEGAVIVAVSSLGGNIFFRGGSQEMKLESDRKKLNFVHPGGDHLTSLNCYKTWSSLKAEKRTKWCVANFINAKSMRIIEETIKDVKHLLSQKFKIHLSPEIDLIAAEAKIPKIIFFAFFRNISLFLGHEKVGYMTAKSPGENVFLFPGAALVHCNLLPKFVLFENTLRISRHFMLQTMPVSEVWIEEAIEQRMLDNEFLSNLQQYIVTPLTVSSIGRTIYGRVFRRDHKASINNLSQLVYPNFLSADFKPESGTITVYTNSLLHDKVKSYISEKTSQVRDELRLRHSSEIGITSPQDDVKVIIGTGGVTTNVIMPYHYKEIMLKCCSTDEFRIAEIKSTLQEFESVCGINLKFFKKTTHFIVTFSNHEAASKFYKTASALPPEISGVIPQYSCFKNRGHNSKPFTLKLKWVRLKQLNYAFLVFNSESDAYIAKSVLMGPVLLTDDDDDYDDEGVKIQFKPSKNRSNEIFVGNASSLPSETLEKLVQSMLPGDIPFRIHWKYEKPFETTTDDKISLEQALNEYICRFSPHKLYKLTLSTPLNHFCSFCAFVEFSDPEEGYKAMNGLKEVTINGQLLEVSLALSSSIRCVSRVYKILKNAIDSLHVKLQSQFGHILQIDTKKDRFSNTIIQIEASEMDAFTVAKKEFTELTTPLIFKFQGSINEQYMLSQMCINYITKLQSSSSTYICINKINMTVDIYGTKENRSQAASELENQLSMFAMNDYKVKEFFLRAPDKPPGLMRHLVSVFGSDLHEITKLEGVMSASLDPCKHILTVVSQDESFQKVSDVIDKYTCSYCPSFSLSTPITCQCSACLCPIENASNIFILEDCGHMYHKECIELQVSKNAIRFPLVCAAESCSCPFMWQDCENMFKQISLTRAELVESSLKFYIQANKDKVRNCLTPDCKMVYVVSEDGERFICSKCDAHICTTCHVQFHDGFSCARYQAMIISTESDKEVEQWLSNNSAKRCPKCFTPIEKTGGCNHIYCTECHSHLCWICLKICKSEDYCYRHLRRRHNGIN